MSTAFGVRRQSEAATALCVRATHVRARQSGAALRLPPHSKAGCALPVAFHPLSFSLQPFLAGIARVSTLNSQLFKFLFSVFCFLLFSSCAYACSVPVFRYALEHWDPASYELLIIHRGPVSVSDQALIGAGSARARAEKFLELNQPGRAAFSLGEIGPLSANLMIHTIDLASASAQAFADRQDLPPLPAMLLRAPGLQQEIWSGALNEQNFKDLLDSPVRRRLVQRLLKGDSAVWMFLESGDRAQDDVAAHLLTNRLAHLQKTLELPKPDAADMATASPSQTLRVSFSFLRLARTDPAEQALVRMLLHSEDDLQEVPGPLAFPVFGRGRLLYALAGPGINAETIDEACSFLIGPCSCIVKDENPGFDLLLSAAWDNVVQLTATPDPPLPELTGVPVSAAALADAPAGQASPRAQPAISQLGRASPGAEPGGLEIPRVTPISLLSEHFTLLSVVCGALLLASLGIWLRGRF